MSPQHTYESCLAWSLLHLADKKPTFKSEVEIVNQSLSFSKKDFTIGHLEAISAHFREIFLFIDKDFKYENNISTRLKQSQNIKIRNGNVLKFLQAYLDIGKIRHPLIIYVDSYALHNQIHYPHYIILLKKQGNEFSILDPWNGKTRFVSQQTILNGVKLLKHHLGFAPRVILARN